MGLTGKTLFSIEHFPKSVARIFNKKCVKNKRIGPFRDLRNFGNALVFSGIAMFGLASETIAEQADGLPIRGVVRSTNTAAISTDLAVPIKQLPFREGQAFNKNDVLVKFDCARFAASRRALVAERKIQFLTYSNNQTLLKHNAIGRFDVEVSQAKVAKADAEIEQLDVRLARCTVKAPFDGMIDQTFVRQFETPKSGVPFVKIIETGKLELELIVPSKWLSWLKPKERFTFNIDETGKSYQAVVVRMGASVDAVSQTVEIKGAFVRVNAEVRAGMSGSATFALPGS